MNLEAALKVAKKKQVALTKMINDGKAGRKELSAQMAQSLSEAEASLETVMTGIASLAQKIKVASLTAQFKGFVKEGRLSKAEFDKLKIVEFATLPKSALDPLVASYAGRAVSTDVLQFGQAGAQPIDLTKQSPSEMRKLIKLQKEGKGVSLEGQEDPKDKKSDPADDKGNYRFEDIDEVMKCMDEFHPVVEKLMGGLKKMADYLKKLAESDDKEIPKDDESEE